MPHPEEIETIKQESSAGPNVEEAEDFGLPTEPPAAPEPEPKPEQEQEPEPEVTKPEVAEPSAKEGEKETFAKILEQQNKILGELTKGKQEVAARPKEAAKPSYPLFRVNPEDMDRFIEGGEEGAKYVNSVLDNVTAQAVDIALRYFEQRIAPFDAYLANQQYNQLKEKFISKYEDLKDHVDIAEEVAMKLIEVKKFNSWDELFDSVATQTREIIKRYKERFGVAPEANREIKTEQPPAPNPSLVRRSKPSLSEDEQMMRAIMED